ncbi:hypothetical protein J437_LFUL002104, partial [Ladona fulva]
MSRFSLLVALLVVLTIRNASSSSRPYHHHHHLHLFDATGRYNAQFLFGNDFFLGSQTLCMELSRNASLWDLDKSRGDPSSFLRWREYPPPFKVNYHVIKLKIKLPPERFQES